MRLSIIIPTHQEASRIGTLCSMLTQAAPQAQLIVADANSSDGTAQKARQAGATVIQVPQPSRAAQMNAAAAVATGDVLWFVHADVQVPSDFFAHIKTAIDQGFSLGGYQYRFDGGPALLRINSFFTRLPFLWCRGGDQTLFIGKALFTLLNGFAEMPIMEEYDLLKRARELGYAYKILPYKILVSARKYQQNSYLQVQWANLQMMRAWRREGRGTQAMLDAYRRLLKPW